MLIKRLKKFFKAITKRNKLALHTYRCYRYCSEIAATQKIKNLIDEIFDSLLSPNVNWDSAQGTRVEHLAEIILFLVDSSFPAKNKQQIKNLEDLLTLMLQIVQELVNNHHSKDIDEIIDLMHTIVSTDAEDFGFDFDDDLDDDFDDDLDDDFDDDEYEIFQSFNQIYHLFYVIINDWKMVKKISPSEVWNKLAYSFYYNLNAPVEQKDYDALPITRSFCDIVYGKKKLEPLYVLEHVSFVVVDKNHKGRIVLKNN